MHPVPPHTAGAVPEEDGGEHHRRRVHTAIPAVPAAVAAALHGAEQGVDHRQQRQNDDDAGEQVGLLFHLSVVGVIAGVLSGGHAVLRGVAAVVLGEIALHAGHQAGHGRVIISGKEIGVYIGVQIGAEIEVGVVAAIVEVALVSADVQHEQEVIALQAPAVEQLLGIGVRVPALQTGHRGHRHIGGVALVKCGVVGAHRVLRVLGEYLGAVAHPVARRDSQHIRPGHLYAENNGYHDHRCGDRPRNGIFFQCFQRKSPFRYHRGRSAGTHFRLRLYIWVSAARAASFSARLRSCPALPRRRRAFRGPPSGSA